MEYLEWNRFLGERFFPSSDGSSTSEYLCVTGQLLAEIGGFPNPESAIQDFVDAIRQGPQWTQIERCSNFASKAHNCLHPDPEWKKRKNLPRKKTEKVALSKHINWRDFREYTDYYPPYLAYLCLLVLAFTERHDDDFGGDFYKPLARILKTNESNALFKKYSHEKQEITFNTIWQDLEKWALEKGKAGFRLPPEKKRDYLYIPLYFGLLKACDLRALDQLFDALVKNDLLAIDTIPSSFDLLEVLKKYKDLDKYISEDGRNIVFDTDSTKRNALKLLLHSKYLEWDGGLIDAEKSSASLRVRGVALLRYLRAGSLQSVVNLRSSRILEKLPMEPDREYSLKNGIEAKLVWPGRSSIWFRPLDFLPSDPFAQATVECEELPIFAKMVACSYMVMENHELPYHLQGENGFVEVDKCKGIEPGRRYLILAGTMEQPKFENLVVSPNHGQQVPVGMSAWWIDVPLSIDREQWPDSLPPLTDTPGDPSPRIKLESFVRVEPRALRFLTGFPLRISSSQGGFKPFILAQENNQNVELKEIDGGWELSSREPSDVTLSLRAMSDNKEVIGSTQKITFVDAECQETKNVSRPLTPIFLSEKNSLPDYPLASILPNGGSMVGTTSDGRPVYLCADRPAVFFKSRLEHDITLFIDRNRQANGDKPYSTAGPHMAEVRYRNNGVLDTFAFELLDLTKKNAIHVMGISQNKSHPTRFNEKLTIDIQTKLERRIDVRFFIRPSGFTKAHSFSLEKSTKLQLGKDSGIMPNLVSEVEFQVGSQCIFTGWIQWLPILESNRPLLRRFGRDGLFNMRRLFDDAQPKDETKGI